MLYLKNLFVVLGILRMVTAEKDAIYKCMAAADITAIDLDELLPNFQQSQPEERSRRLVDTELLCRAIFERSKNMTAEINSRQTDLSKLNHKYAKLVASIGVKKSGCFGYIEGIGNPIAHRTNKWQAFGTWSQDVARNDGHIWVSQGLTFNRIQEYVSLQDFKSNSHFFPHDLPFSCDGTGMVVYGGNLYCNKAQSRNLIKYDMKKRISVQKELPNAGYRDTYSYQFGGYSDIDLHVDESGLWVIYSTSQNFGNIVISKLNENDLTFTGTWRTDYPKRNAGNAFIACGVMYVTNAFNQSPSYISYTYDTRNSKGHLLGSESIPFDNTDTEAYSEIISMKYNRNEKCLYSWSFYKQYTFDTLTKL